MGSFMDIVKYIAVLFCLLSASFAFAETEKQLIELLPGEDVTEKLRQRGIDLDSTFTANKIENSLTKFNQATDSVRAGSLAEKPELSPKEIEKIKEYTSNDSYLVTLSFQTETQYPGKYRSQNHFIEDTTPEFFDEVSGKIFSELLGAEFERFEPELIAVFKNEVGILAKFQDESELRQLISLPGVVNATHYGNAQQIEEISGSVAR